MLRLENISTGYNKKQVLFDISLELNQGETVLLVGSNGSGKSTLLKAIYGILPQWGNGKVFFDGDNITGKPTATLLKKGLLYIPQKNNLFEDLTVKENFEMAGLTMESNLMKQRIEQVLSIFPLLTPHLQRTPMKLSGGERQLLTLAMASLYEPLMILCDEPFTGLSGKNFTLVADILKMLSTVNGITLLIVEHRVKEVLDFADKVIGLKLGRLNTVPLKNVEQIKSFLI